MQSDFILKKKKKAGEVIHLISKCIQGSVMLRVKAFLAREVQKMTRRENQTKTAKCGACDCPLLCIALAAVLGDAQIEGRFFSSLFWFKQLFPKDWESDFCLIRSFGI